MRKSSREQAAEAGKSARKASILIVESDPDLLSLLAGTFRLQDFQVYAASSAKDASEAYRAIGHPVDVVLLNGNAAGVAGIDAVIAIRRINPGQKILLIAENENTKVNAMKVRGLHVAIMKPLTADKMVAEVRKLMRQAKT